MTPPAKLLYVATEGKRLVAEYNPVVAIEVICRLPTAEIETIDHIAAAGLTSSPRGRRADRPTKLWSANDYSCNAKESLFSAGWPAAAGLPPADRILCLLTAALLHNSTRDQT